MTESEIMQAFLTSGQVVVSLFSMFFAMISAYIAGLYFFLNHAPIALRFLHPFSSPWVSSSSVQLPLSSSGCNRA